MPFTYKVPGQDLEMTSDINEGQFYRDEQRVQAPLSSQTVFTLRNGTLYILSVPEYEKKYGSAGGLSIKNSGEEALYRGFTSGAIKHSQVTTADEVPAFSAARNEVITSAPRPDNPNAAVISSSTQGVISPGNPTPAGTTRTVQTGPGGFPIMKEESILATMGGGAPAKPVASGTLRDYGLPSDAKIGSPEATGFLLSMKPAGTPGAPAIAPPRTPAASTAISAVSPQGGTSASMGAGGTPVVPNPADIAKLDTDANKEMEDALHTIADSSLNVDTKTSLELATSISKLLDKKPPTAPSYLETFNKQRAELGIDKLQSDLSNIDTKIAKMDSDIRAQLAAEGDRLVSMPQINRRKSALQVQYENDRSGLLLEKNTIANELNVKMGTLNTMMTLTGKDYETAKAEFDFQYNKSIQMLNLWKGLEDSQKSQQDRAQDNARATWQVMITALEKGSISSDNWSAQTKLDIKNLELQMGVPIGFTELVHKASAGKEIAFHTTTPDKRGEIIYYKDGSQKIVDFGAYAGGPDEATATARLNAENKIRDDFRTELLKWDKRGTREQLIARLRAAFSGQINKDDIERAVYDAYPNGYDE